MANINLASEFECSVCLEIPKAGSKIYQCFSGHILCSICNEKLEYCPVCQKKLESVRNLVAERCIPHILKNPIEDIEDMKIQIRNIKDMKGMLEYFTEKLDLQLNWLERKVNNLNKQPTKGHGSKSKRSTVKIPSVDKCLKSPPVCLLDGHRQNIEAKKCKIKGSQTSKEDSIDINILQESSSASKSGNSVNQIKVKNSKNNVEELEAKRNKREKSPSNSSNKPLRFQENKMIIDDTLTEVAVCPMCFIAFPNNELQSHATSCEGYEKEIEKEYVNLLLIDKYLDVGNEDWLWESPFEPNNRKKNIFKIVRLLIQALLL